MDYGKGAYSRTRGNLPELPVINMFVEQSKADGVVMQSHKELSAVATVGAGPVLATLRKDGVFGGDRFVISGGKAYRGSTELGDVAGDGVAFIVASDSEVIFGRGGPIYSYNGTDFVEVDFPDDANVPMVVYTAGYFIAICGGTGKWYFSAIGDGRTWDGLDFATAENEPDRLLDLALLDGVIIMAGAESIEFWAPTGEADIPYAPIQQRVFEQGIIGTGCIVVVDNTFYWIGNDAITYRNGEVPQAVSDDGIVERSKAATSHRLFLIEDERHKFVTQQHDGNTMMLDVTTGEWSERQSYGRSNWLAGPGLGSRINGTVYELSGYGAEGDVFERRFRAGERISGVLSIDNIRLTCETGTTGYLTGINAAPVIEMRDSRDAGNIWSDWEQITLGEQGQYRERVEWRALGMFDDPGALFEFRLTAPVSFRLSGVEANADVGGRSR